MGHQYLALSTSISAALNFALLFLAMRRYAKGLHGRELSSAWLPSSLASVLCMAGVCWLAQVTVLGGWAHYGFWLRLVTLGVTIAVAAVVYFGVNMLLKNEEVAVFSASCAGSWANGEAGTGARRWPERATVAASLGSWALR